MALCTRSAYCVCRHEECKSYGIINDSTVILKDNLGDLAVYGRIRAPEEAPDTVICGAVRVKLKL
jgi:hypothetical protein